MTPSDVPSLFGTVITTLGDILVAGLVPLLSILAALIGLGFLLRSVKKYIDGGISESDWARWRKKGLVDKKGNQI